jgi:hypothetical protein
MKPVTINRLPPPSKLRYGLLLLAILTLVVALNVFLYVRQQHLESWRYITPDGLRIASMFQAIAYPQTFPHDELFRNGDAFRFYTPSFFALMRLFADGTDAIVPFIPIAGLVLLFYIPSATFFFWVISRNIAVSALMALVSTYGLPHNQEFWQLNDLYSTLPRSVAMPLVMVVFAGVFGAQYLLKKRDVILVYALCGLGIGITANLHPTTGITSTIIILGLAILWRIRQKTPPVMAFVAFIGMASVSAVPILLTVVGNSSFSTETQARDLSSAFQVMRYLGIQQYPLVLLNLIVIIVTWFFAKPNTRWQLVFCLVQIPIFGLLIRGSVQPQWAILLYVAMPAFIIYRYLQKTLHTVFAYFEWLACVLVVCQLVSFLIFVILPYQASAYIWSTEVMRAVRLLSLPIFALIAVVLAEKPNGWQVLPYALWLGLAYVAIILHWTLLVLVVGLWAVYAVGIVHRWAWMSVMWQALLVGVATFMVLRWFFALYALYCVQVAVIALLVALIIEGIHLRLPLDLRFRRMVIFLTPVLCLSLTTLLHQNPTDLYKTLAEQLLFSFMVAFLLASGIVLIVHDFRLVFWQVLVGVVAIIALQTASGLAYQRYDFVAPNVYPYIRAAQWAKQNTPQDSLFYMVNQANDFGFAIEFRVYSLRSISHNMNEANLYRYANPEDTPMFEERHAEQIASYQNAESLIAMAQQYNADYILIDTNFLGYRLDLPIAFSQENIIIYSLPPIP